MLKLLGWCVGLTHEVRGAANLPVGPAIIAMKHQSAWDTFAVPVVFSDPAIVLKRELHDDPVLWLVSVEGRHDRHRPRGRRGGAEAHDGVGQGVSPRMAARS